MRTEAGWLLRDTSAHRTHQRYNSSRAGAAVTLALSLGYTHVDTAIGYDNQIGIAQALKASPRPRDSYFVTSKVCPGVCVRARARARMRSNDGSQLQQQ